jgi:hypothetical protein
VSFDSGYAAEPHRDDSEDDSGAPPEWVILLLDGMQQTMAAAITDAVTAAAKILTTGQDDKPKHKALFKNVVDWVENWLAPTVVRRDNNDVRWCASWWDHPEVISRLQGLWETWEQSRSTPAAMLDWYQQHLDHHFARITSPNGPMAHCKRDEHNGRGPALPLNPVPEGTFTAGGPAIPPLN